jgi:membrane-bound serine protease (ClpP class)
MAPGTNLGAATPIQLGGGGPLPGGDEGPAGENGEAEDDAPAGQPSGAAGAKAVNDAVAFLRSLAELHDRDAGFAEAAVREAESLSATAALDRGVVEIVAPSLDELLEAADGRTVRVGDGTVTLATADLAVETVEPGWRAELLAAIANPNVAYILMLIGIYGIIFEFASPGTIFPGVIGAISLLVGLFALNLVGIDYVGAGLALLGIALMVAEAFAPSFGILGIGGAIAFALGSVFMFEDAPGFALSWPVVIGATAVTAGLLAVVLAIVVRAQRRRSVSGGDAIVGSLGEVVDWSGEEGEVRLHGELWRARSSAALEPGDRVEITARDSLILTVEPAGERRAS